MCFLVQTPRMVISRTSSIDSLASAPNLFPVLAEDRKKVLQANNYHIRSIGSVKEKISPEKIHDRHTIDTPSAARVKERKELSNTLPSEQ